MNSKTKKAESQFQGPSKITLDDQVYRLGEYLTHTASKNVYWIKEIQAKGFIVWLSNSMGEAVKEGNPFYRKNVYISFENLHEYM